MQIEKLINGWIQKWKKKRCKMKHGKKNSKLKLKKEINWFDHQGKIHCDNNCLRKKERKKSQKDS